MTRHRIRIASLRWGLWKIVTLFTVCLTPLALIAQTEKPEVLVSMYFASELDACRPDGYPERDDETPRSCAVLTFDDLDKMVSQGLAEAVQQSIPPEQLRLGDDLIDSIDSFVDDCPEDAPCLDSSRRYAMILTFKVDLESTSNDEISISRTHPTDSRFNPYSIGGKLSASGRWLNHQRADVFAPGYRVRWLLRIDEWTWDLGTAR